MGMIQQRCKYILLKIHIKNGSWILDVRFTWVQTNYFQAFKKVDGGKVTLGNNKVCKITIIGSMNVRVFDACDRVLQNVRYVLEHWRNLISLRILDLLGCSIKIQNGLIKVANGALTIIMKENFSNGLYSWIDTIITRSRGSNTGYDMWHDTNTIQTW